VKNYPEFPDDDDVTIKDLAEECGVEDFRRAEKIVSLIRELGMFAIQSRRFVVDALDFYFPEHRVRRFKDSPPSKTA